ncbi:hypothetical protein WICPIJ_004153 [Wickerhamomyces pijperi]|uniref:Trafficking protein particle complex III-specific subunit 85 n=1 Tax=Wickerhamomyces pijperi TaxID=599730 RepID=A0A9P8TN69_WICPI|nr:hypothetical protein WICPIJ_004153 [Wickerhamomyces pijperi]
MMDHNLTSNNIQFYLDSHKDISELITQYQLNPKKTSFDCRSIIVNAFSPQVTVSCSPEVDLIADNFGFPSFFQLLKPFGDKVINQFQVKDSQMASRTTQDFSLRFTRPLNDLVSVQQAQQQQHSTSSSSFSGNNNNKLGQLFSYQSLELLIDEYIQSITDRTLAEEQAGNHQLVKVLSDSVYIKFFTKLMSSSYMTSFETMNHPVSSFLVITARNTLEDAKQQLLQFRQSSIPSYMNIDDILPLMIVVHDERDTQQEKTAYQLRESIKSQLGIEVFVLGIITSLESQVAGESRKLNPPVLTSIDDELQTLHLPHADSKELPLSNIKTIYRLLKEIIQKQIIPFMERKISVWDTEVVIPRKSFSGRFFSVSKRYFGGNSSSNGKSDGSGNGNGNNYDPLTCAYPQKSNEMIIRKLADWSFMLRDYRYAYSTYELVKKDFLSDKAWPHLASAQEMAAMSLLMGATNITSKLKKDTIDPLLDDSNYTYLSRCGLKTYALRSMIIVSELFCNLKDDWMSAPSAIRWLRKAIDDNLLGRLGKCLVLERIGYVYGLYVESRAKVIINRKLLTATPHNKQTETEAEAESEETQQHLNPHKLRRNNMATIGLTRHRKSTLWKLLAAKEWDPSSRPLQVKLKLNEVEHQYKQSQFTSREGTLYAKLDRLTKDRLS